MSTSRLGTQIGIVAKWTIVSLHLRLNRLIVRMGFNLPEALMRAFLNLTDDDAVVDGKKGGAAVFEGVLSLMVHDSRIKIRIKS